MAKVGLVTVLYYSNEVLDDFLRSLSKQTFQAYFLYIVDNSVNEKTNELLENLLNQYSITNFEHIKCSENYGVAKGNNIGIEKALKDGCDYVLLLNNDIEFEQPDLISGMVQYSIINKENIIIPKILFYDSQKIWMAGGNFQWYRVFTKHIGENELDGEQYNSIKKFNYAPTCFMLIHRKVFQNVGLMDEKYFVYVDDTDFIYRSVQRGYAVLYLPFYTVLHKVSSLTGGELSPFSVYLCTRNRIYFVRKNFVSFKKFISLNYLLLVFTIKIFLSKKKFRKSYFVGIIDGFKH